MGPSGSGRVIRDSGIPERVSWADPGSGDVEDQGELMGRNGHSTPAPGGTLTADIRHDLRHAASTLLLLVATLRDDAFGGETNSACDGIVHCARSILAMVSDDDEDLTELVAVDEVAAIAAHRGSLLYVGKMEVEVAPAVVDGTWLDISRLLVNLIENACRAAGSTGTVRLVVRTDGSWCEIEVGDSGAGFLENPTAKGMGLWAVTAIAVRLRGFVTFGRSSLGGALVTIHLPLAAIDDLAVGKQGTPS
jgi:signal transduction histidine kinase